MRVVVRSVRVHVRVRVLCGAWAAGHLTRSRRARDDGTTDPCRGHPFFRGKHVRMWPTGRMPSAGMISAGCHMVSSKYSGIFQ